MSIQVPEKQVKQETEEMTLEKALAVRAEGWIDGTCLGYSS